jgi:Spy/CpxP family protein refolding chaperone
MKNELTNQHHCFSWRKMMKFLLTAIIAFFALVTWVLPQASTELTLRKYLFSPQLLRRHQHELKLTQEQREYIVREINAAQSEFTAMQWNLESEIRGLTRLVENRESEESAILEQLNSVLDLEKEIKRKQLLMAVRIRNKLSDEQLRILRDIRLRAAQEIRRRGSNPRPQRDELP